MPGWLAGWLKIRQNMTNKCPDILAVGGGSETWPLTPYRADETFQLAGWPASRQTATPIFSAAVGVVIKTYTLSLTEMINPPHDLSAGWLDQLASWI